MSLYNLKREYEERRRQLVEQLQKNPSLDPATQHQIYGAIKEIENFMRTIEYQISAEQERNMNVDLARPNPAVEKTKGAIYHVTQGTKKVFTHHIPNATRAAVNKVTAVPKQYFDRKREEARLRREIEEEIRRRRDVHQAQLTHTTEHVVLEHPHQELALQPNASAPEHNVVQHVPETQETGPLPTWNDETHVRADEGKRAKSIVRPKKATHPAKKARAKHQHKPHTKDERYKGTKGHKRR